MLNEHGNGADVSIIQTYKVVTWNIRMIRKSSISEGSLSL